MIATPSCIPYKCPAGVGFLFTVLASQWLGKAMPPSSSHLVASVSTQTTVCILLHSHSNPGCNGCWEPPGPDWQLRVPCPSPEDIKQTTTSVRCGNKCPGDKPPWQHLDRAPNDQRNHPNDVLVICKIPDWDHPLLHVSPPAWSLPCLWVFYVLLSWQLAATIVLLKLPALQVGPEADLEMCTQWEAERKIRVQIR